MKDYMTIYKEWLENPYFDEATKEELRAIEGDENEIKERFYMDLEFGTAGLRGIIGAGINRMNIYTVRRATQGLIWTSTVRVSPMYSYPQIWSRSCSLVNTWFGEDARK